jgi:predicted O-linked N-acetylglucosamine transferase (SPINDLY family)
MPAVPLSQPKPDTHDRLRIGYLSADFREHAVAYLMTGVLEQHDKRRFEITALSLRAPDTGRYGLRIATAVDRYVDLSQVSDAQAAEQIRALQIDVLVDLVGHTQGSRGNILAQRPAPVQINYLGYPGTSGARYIDYLLADEYLIPPASRSYYSESIVYLPDCFQANDDRRAVAGRVTDRAEYGLPAEGPVLCCFNNSFKLTPDCFDIWMRLLLAHPAAVLWLVAQHALTQRNLRHEAQRRGVDPNRLIFAAQLPYEQHLARLGCADLFLDTLPFNGGTTVSDALWAGLPVISCSGEALASRMGGSLLRAVGLDELVSSDLAGYERLALALLADRRRLTALKARLLEQRQHSVLFDTARFTRHLEAAYLLVWQRCRQRLPPKHLQVLAMPPAPLSRA